MYIYILILIVLWTFVYVDSLSKNIQTYKIMSFISILILILLAGLRISIGYDWIAYEHVFYLPYKVGDIFKYLWSAPGESNKFISLVDAAIRYELRYEPLFLLSIKAIKFFRGDFQAFLLVICLFSTACTVYFFKYFKINIIQGCALYYSWMFLVLQMGVLRQSIALSIFLVGFVYFDRKKYFATLLMCTLAIGFQYSSLIYGLLFIPLIYKNLSKYYKPVILACLILFVTPLNIIYVLFKLLSLLHLSVLSQKIALYSLADVKSRSISSIFFFLFNLILTYFLIRKNKSDKPIDKVFISGSISLLAAQAVAGNFPILWNRVWYLSFFCQLALFSNYLNQNISDQIKKISLYVGTLVSITVFMFFLLKPDMKPYFPYTNYIDYYFDNNEGIGRERAEEYQKIFDATYLPPEALKIKQQLALEQEEKKKAGRKLVCWNCCNLIYVLTEIPK